MEQKSKLVLGTVQFGMKYGINNTHGQPTLEESFLMLDEALSSGINTFDTAYGYGEAEDVLGKWIQSRSLAGKVYIISKMKPHVLNEYPDGTMVADIVQLELEKSLKRLCVNSLDGYLLHSPHYIYLNHVMDALKKVKELGLVKNVGVSIYNEDEALQAAELGVDYIQVPYNILDQRLDAVGFFELAQKNKVTVFARSPFLQGLLLMQPAHLPEHLSYVRPYLEKFLEIAKRKRMSPLEASLVFVEEHCRAEHIVFGVDTLAQLREDLAIVNNLTPNQERDWILEIEDCFRNINRGAINPSLWSKIKK